MSCLGASDWFHHIFVVVFVFCLVFFPTCRCVCQTDGMNQMFSLIGQTSLTCLYLKPYNQLETLMLMGWQQCLSVTHSGNSFRLCLSVWEKQLCLCSHTHRGVRQTEADGTCFIIALHMSELLDVLSCAPLTAYLVRHMVTCCYYAI